jgi:CheY-like chemotaxis protein
MGRKRNTTIAGVRDDAGPVHVLCVDDDIGNIALFERVLSLRQGYVLHAALSGATGLQRARHVIPHVIVLDLDLPDMTGEQVLAQLRTDATTAAVPVLVLSADTDESRRAALVDAGIDAYVNKPFDVLELLDLLDRMVPAPQW